MNLSNFCSWVVKRLFSRFCLGLRTFVLGALSCFVRILTTRGNHGLGSPSHRMRALEDKTGAGVGSEGQEPNGPRCVSADNAPADATRLSWALPTFLTHKIMNNNKVCFKPLVLKLVGYASVVNPNKWELTENLKYIYKITLPSISIYTSSSVEHLDA